jgi:AraC-like DNA-binding protein
MSYNNGVRKRVVHHNRTITKGNAMVFGTLKDFKFESTTFSLDEEVFSLIEIGTLRVDHAKIQIESQNKNDCLLIYLRRGHIIVHHAKNDQAILRNELVLIPLGNGVQFSYADAEGDFLVIANFPSADLNRNHQRVPVEIEPDVFDEFLVSVRSSRLSETLIKQMRNLAIMPIRDLKQRTVIRKTLIYINKNLSKRVMLDDICETIDYSKFHFIRIFDEFVGLTPHQYICDRRLYLARDLLGETDLSISDVAMRSGISFASNFYSHFKRKFKVTPKDYRETITK